MESLSLYRFYLFRKVFMKFRLTEQQAIRNILRYDICVMIFT